MPLRLAAAACLCLVASLACATRPRVESDPAHDFAAARRWNWLPQERLAAPLVTDAALRERLGASIERELTARGLERSEEPDLLASCQLAVSRERVLRTETPATTFLPSLHGGEPSYYITASRTQQIEYERVALRIALTDARSGKVVWSVYLVRRVRGSFLERADEAVATLLSELPPLAVTPPLEAALRLRGRG